MFSKRPKTTSLMIPRLRLRLLPMSQFHWWRCLADVCNTRHRSVQRDSMHCTCTLILHALTTRVSERRATCPFVHTAAARARALACATLCAQYTFTLLSAGGHAHFSCTRGISPRKTYIILHTPRSRDGGETRGQRRT